MRLFIKLNEGSNPDEPFTIVAAPDIRKSTNLCMIRGLLMQLKTRSKLDSLQSSVDILVRIPSCFQNVAKQGNLTTWGQTFNFSAATAAGP